MDMDGYSGAAGAKAGPGRGGNSDLLNDTWDVIYLELDHSLGF